MEPATIITNAILTSLSEADYNAAPGARSTQLKTIVSKSPAHSLIWKPQTPAMLLGTQLHTALFEQDRLVLSPKFDRRTKDGKAAFDLFMNENSGKILLDPDAYEQVKSMADAINAHPEASDALSKGRTEIACFWNEDFIPCKAKFDLIDTDKRLIVDLKTCRDASPQVFGRQVANLKYHLQAAHYLSGAYHATGLTFDFRIVAVETEAPYAVMVYELDFGTLEKGEALRQDALKIYQQCTLTAEWPSYPTGIHSLAIPSWAFNEGEE